MPRRFALVAALAVVLAATSCAAGQFDPTTLAGQEPSTQTSQAGASQAAPSDSGASPSVAGPAGSAEASQLRTGSLDASLRTNAGEPGLPEGSGASVDDVLRLGAMAAWVDAPRTFSVSLPASAECWPAAGEPMVMSEREITVAYAVPSMCEEPDSARTYVFDLPAGIDSGAPIEIRVEGLPSRFTLPLPAA